MVFQRGLVEAAAVFQQEGVRRLYLLEEEMGSTVEGPLPVHRQQQFAPRRQEVTVAAQPAHVAAVKADHKGLGQLGRRGGDSLDPPEQERRADRLALAEWIDLDEPDVQRQLDRRIAYLRQCGLSPG